MSQRRPRRHPRLGRHDVGLAHRWQPYAFAADARMVRPMHRGGEQHRLLGVVPLLVVALMLGCARLAWCPMGLRRSRAAPAPAEALLIGDSVLNGLAQGYGAPARAALAARHSFVLDSAGCRRLITTSCRIPPGSAPTNAITVLRERAGQYDRALVIAAGYDDPSIGRIRSRRGGRHHHRRGPPPGHPPCHLADVSRGRNARERCPISGEQCRSAQPHRSRVVTCRLGDRVAPRCRRVGSLPTASTSGTPAVAAMAELIGDALDHLVARTVHVGGLVGQRLAECTAARDQRGRRWGRADAEPRYVCVDTRDLPGKLGAGRMLTVPIAGSNGVPPDAVAAVVSITAVEPCADTFLTAFPCGTASADRIDGQRGRLVDRRQFGDRSTRRRVLVRLHAPGRRRDRRRQRLDRAGRVGLDAGCTGASGRHPPGRATGPACCPASRGDRSDVDGRCRRRYQVAQRRRPLLPPST